MFYEECTLEEVIAYRELEGEPFDFGTGLLHWDFIYGTEEVYYKMRIEQEMEEGKRKKDNTSLPITPPTPLPTFRARKEIEQKRMRELYHRGWWMVSKRSGYYKRNYYSARRGYLRRQANKRVRKASEVGNHGSYRKVYDYWWMLF